MAQQRRTPNGRKPISRKTTTGAKKPGTTAGKPSAKAPYTPQKAKSVPGSKAGFTGQMRAAGQRVGALSKPESKPVKLPENKIELARSIKAANGGANVFVLDVPWEYRDYALGLGAKWNSQLGEFIYTGTMLPERLKEYITTEYSLSRWIEDEINGKIRIIQPGVNKMKPRPHQIVAINKIVNCGLKGWTGFIEADSTGVGKTLSSLMGISELAKIKGYTRTKPAKVLITCPKSVIPHWKNTLKSIKSDHLRVVVINYDQSKKLLTVPTAAAEAKKASTKNRAIAKAGKPLIRWDYIIADEAHKLKNSETSQRAKAFSQIARYAEKQETSPFIIWATATIAQTPLEVGYLAPLIGQILKTKLTPDNWGKYLEENGYHVTAGKTYRWISIKPNMSAHQIAEIKEQQKEDIKRISEILFSPNSPSIRRLPDNIAGWPTINRMRYPVQLDSTNMALYKQIWTEFRNYLALHPHGKDPQGGLAQQMRFRQKASLLRTLDTIEFVTDLVDNEYQVAISIQFMESLDIIKNGLTKKGIKAVEFSGRPGLNREDQRIIFQKGKADVILFTPTEGISLHAGEQLADGTKASLKKRVTVVHDNRYTAFETTQIEGRAHRDGQLANIYYMYAENTIEEPMTQNTINRMANMSALSGDTEDIVSIFEDLLAKGYK